MQPEWFYKGDGAIVAASGQPLVSPSFALDGGEEPEMVGLYLIGPDGTPWRVGFALGNEFSDHVTEKQNYLYLAHSKLRACAHRPGAAGRRSARDIRGTSRIRRGGEVVWEKPFLSGEDNMCHSIENLERHHFKYPLFRRPGDVHVALLRHRDAELLRRVQDPAGRRVRDRGGRVRPAAAQRVGGSGDSGRFRRGRWAEQALVATIYP